MRRVALVAVSVMAIVGCPASAAPPEPLPRLSYLDNGTIRVGVNLDLGGAITYLAKSGEPNDADNLVNNWDWGRQIQMSHYAGPVPFTPGGKQPAPHWRGLGWNPVQAGDHFRNRSKVLEHANDGKTLTVRCAPMQWPLDNVPADCEFETSISLDGPAVRVACRLTNKRDDPTQYPARDQELPAVYTVGTLYRLFSYTGDRPFTGGAPERVEKTAAKHGPWLKWRATERWAALVDDRDFGVGVWSPMTTDFIGGFAGRPGAGGTRDDPTGYIAPVRPEILDHDIVYEFNYVLIVGPLAEIRRYVYDHAARPAPPDYVFASDRQGWCYAGATDAGWPIKGELDVRPGPADPQLIGPPGFWLAADAPKLYVEAAFRTRATEATVFWRRHDDDGFSGGKCVSFPVRPDGQFHVYEINLSGSTEYKGALTGLRLDPVGNGAAGDRVKIRRISFRKPDVRP